MLVNLDRCIGCHTCTVACQMEKGLPPSVALIPVRTIGGIRDVPQGSFPALHLDYVPRPCAHCQNPPCAQACPTGALYQRADGLVLTDGSLCTGCGDCVPACPYEAVVLDADSVAHKCDLCASRLDDGLEPFCVLCCPSRAISINAEGGGVGFVPAHHSGTEASLRYDTRDTGRQRRVSEALIHED